MKVIADSYTVVPTVCHFDDTLAQRVLAGPIPIQDEGIFTKITEASSGCHVVKGVTRVRDGTRRHHAMSKAHESTDYLWQ